MDYVKQICVIGSGATGLTCIKQCCDENVNVTCYEKSDFIGGLWKYRDEDVDGLASVTRSTIINSSKELSAYSDFPPPKEFATFMHNVFMHRYFEMYAEHFGLTKYVNFKHEVLKVEHSQNFEQTGRWRVTVKNLITGAIISKEFDGVMVATGHHVKPLVPTFPGQEKFKGTIIHTHSYKKPDPFAGKRVVVVGIGNSGGDAAVELSSISSRVYLSTRRGAWVNFRVGHSGKPFDALFIRRFWNALFNSLPYGLVNTVFEFLLNTRMDHKTYGLKPDHRFFSQHPMVNDALPNRIISGTIVLKGNIKEFTEDGVIFYGDNEVTPCDAVVLATGYEISFPFLDLSIIDPSGNELELYKYVFLPKSPRPETLGFIGFVQSFGPLIPVSEMQSRWFLQVFLGKRSLPSVEVMLEDIREKRRRIADRYFAGARHTIQIDWVNYMDEIASQFGAKPNLFKLFVTDPVLAFCIYFGPCLPYQYRLEGPHSWPGAREAILTAEDRIQAALKTRHRPTRDKDYNKSASKLTLSLQKFPDFRVYIVSAILVILCVVQLYKLF